MRLSISQLTIVSRCTYTTQPASTQSKPTMLLLLSRVGFATNGTLTFKCVTCTDQCHRISSYLHNVVEKYVNLNSWTEMTIKMSPHDRGVNLHQANSTSTTEHPRSAYWHSAQTDFPTTHEGLCSDPGSDKLLRLPSAHGRKWGRGEGIKGTPLNDEHETLRTRPYTITGSVALSNECAYIYNSLATDSLRQHSSLTDITRKHL